MSVFIVRPHSFLYATRYNDTGIPSVRLSVRPKMYRKPLCRVLHMFHYSLSLQQHSSKLDYISIKYGDITLSRW